MLHKLCESKCIISKFKMPHINLTAYDTFERFEDFDSEKKYRDSKLKECEKHYFFLKKNIKKTKLNVLELGSGNSKLLYKLSLENLLKNGVGIEISESRFNFAERWKKDLNIENIININDNFLNLDKYSIDSLDVCLVVDLAFQFCEPLGDRNEIKILQKIHQKLQKGGKLILELDKCSRILKNTRFSNKIWEEFKDPDPWRFSLWDVIYNKKTNFLTWKKIYVSRNDDKIDETQIILKLYTKKEIEKILKKVGFKNCIFFENWTENQNNSNPDEFIVICTK